MAAPKSRKPKAGARPGPRCRTCGKTIDVPEGWSHGPAVRRHYWAEHRDVMTTAPKKGAE
ncbi:MAG TPA: hypothetical protein VG318_08435 [Actinomycetota bacterium]|nr:hypothetical protein [Actinomycetota bacterium]